MTKINQNYNDISNNSSLISANTAKITKNKNDIAAVKVLANTVPSLTLTRGIEKRKRERKAGDTTSHGNNNILATVTVPKTGKFLVSFRVVIQPKGMVVSGYNKSSWYETMNVPTGNHKLKSRLYKSNSKLSNTEVVTDGDIYAKGFPHHIFYEEVMDLSYGDVLKLKSWCDEFGDNYSLLFFNAFDAQIFVGILKDLLFPFWDQNGKINAQLKNTIQYVYRWFHRIR